METAKIKQLIVEHKDRFLKKGLLVRRTVQGDLDPLLAQREAIVITGARRSGKSTLLNLVCRDLMKDPGFKRSSVLYLNFEDERFIDFSYQDFEKLYDLFLEIEKPPAKRYFFLDEIQNIKGWERWINRLYEFENVKIFVTGSNAGMSGTEISAALTGRNRQITLYPFSFREFLAARNCPYREKDLYLKEKKAEIRNLLKEYVRLGGFPEVVKNKDASLLEQYFKDILYRDIIARYSIRHIKEMKEICLYLASNAGTICSYKNLKEVINSKNIGTIKNYLEILENVFLFFKLNLFDYSIKKQIYNPGKFYSIDTGFSNSIGFHFSENIGRIYENLVFLELKRRNKEVYYWKSNNGKKVDFLTKKGTGITGAFQVCLDLENKTTKDREMSGLIAAEKELNVNQATVLTDNVEGEEKLGNLKVHILPLWKWLLT